MAITKEQWDAAVAEYGPRVRVVSFQDPENDEVLFEGIVRGPTLTEFAHQAASISNADGDAKKLLETQRWYAAACCVSGAEALSAAIDSFPFILPSICNAISKAGGAGGRLISKKFEGPNKI